MLQLMYLQVGNHEVSKGEFEPQTRFYLLVSINISTVWLAELTDTSQKYHKWWMKAELLTVEGQGVWGEAPKSRAIFAIFLVKTLF